MVDSGESGALDPSAGRAQGGSASLDGVVRAQHGRLFAAVAASCGGDLERAEEALQDAYAEALEDWGREGAPTNPAGWLVTVARRRLLDRARSDDARARREEGAGRARGERVAPDPADALDDAALPDERLRLLFTCCHPALSPEVRVALTLRAVSGLSTEAIARAFLVATDAMAQRLVRAKRKIRDAGIPFVVPPPEHFQERLGSVLAVVYLVFNEGYASSEGARWMRHELCAEALSIAELLTELVPVDGEVRGLCALLTLLDARREARLDVDGLPLLLAEQDRARWDRRAIARGVLQLGAALRCGPLGPYGLQAAIAAAHAEAARPEDTPWRRILVLYDRLLALAPTPVIRLNRIAALAMAVGTRDALAELGRLESDVPELRGYVWTHALRAELLARTGRLADAQRAYDRAVSIAGTEAQRAHLVRRSAALAARS